MDGEALLLLAEFSRDVAVLQWPRQDDERVALDHLGLPRLLVLDLTADAPPFSPSCLEDWVRLPVATGDLRARLMTLAHRSKAHVTAPRIDALGRLWHRGAYTRLSPTEERLAGLLLERFGEVVTDDDLLDVGWADESATRAALRIHLTRLRRQLRPLGLEIKSRRGAGHVMDDTHVDTAVSVR